jgi:hypothetical protein
MQAMRRSRLGFIPKNPSSLSALIVVSPMRRHAFQIHGGSAYFDDNPARPHFAMRESIKSAKGRTKC